MKAKTNLCTQNFYTNLDLLVLVYDSAIGTQFELKQTTINVLHALCRHYNHNKGVMYPACKTIASKINSTRETVNKAIKELNQKGLILIEKSKKHNIYKFTDKFFSAVGEKKACRKSKNITLEVVESRKISHKHNNNHEHYKLTSSCNTVDKETNNNDDKLPKELFLKLKSWSVSGINQLIKKYGLDRIEECIQEVESRKPNNYGAYLRSLLASYTSKKQSEDSLYQERIKKLLDDQRSHLNDVELAKIQLLSYNPHQVKYLKDSQIEHIAELVTKWNFTTNKYVFLEYLFNELNVNDILKSKYDKAVSRFVSLI